MFARKKQKKPEIMEENPFVLSFSDLMAGLLAIFILALIVTMLELQKRKEELINAKEQITKDGQILDKAKDKINMLLSELRDSLSEIQTLQSNIANALKGVNQREQSLATMLEDIQENLKARGVELIVAENGSVLRIPEQGLSFALGKYEILPAYEKNADAIGEALAIALEQESNRRMLDTVFIEGHTDAVANSREMGNWGLSTYRAISLWNYWTHEPGMLANLKDFKNIPANSQQAPRPLVSVSGYAETRSTHPPEVAMQLKPDRPEDRRIDIRFTLAASEKKDLENLQSDLKSMQDKTKILIQKLQASEKHEP